MDSEGDGRSSAGVLVARYLSQRNEGAPHPISLSPDIIMQGFLKASLAMLLSEPQRERTNSLMEIMEYLCGKLSDLYGRDMSTQLGVPWSLMCCVVSDMEFVSCPIMLFLYFLTDYLKKQNYVFFVFILDRV